MVGKTLSHYTIVEKLGAGGMGEVYRAEDTVLGREVAIKLLPEAFTADPERLARFEREAKLLAAVNHPHIAAIHSFESSDETYFLVMELVGGRTLAERLARGAVPVAEALPMALQIAQALEAAHERGIVHRDLKPGNIKLTADNRVKVLDFGLAKPVADAASAELTHSPTMTYSPTQAGVLLGTAAYMSPEQARGQEVDRRSDIWAFGVVLWEMLTGRRLFDGDTVSDILAAVLRAEPEWGQLPEGTPRAVHRVLHRCLSRDASERLHDIADARLEIEEAITHPERTEAATLGVAERSTRWHRLRTSWWALPAAIAIGALLASLGWWLSPRPSTPASIPIRATLTLPPEVVLASSGRTELAASPDGRWLVYTTWDGTHSRLLERRLDQFEAAPIRGLQDTDAAQPFLSPDGEWLGFWDWREEQLKKISLRGGAPVALGRANSPWGASWGPDGTIVYVPEDPEGIWRLPAVGGEPEPLLVPSAELGAWDLAFPEVLPNGKSVLFTGFRGLTAASAFIGLLELDSGETRVLLDTGSAARYLPSGHLIYLRGGRVQVVPFNPDRGEITRPSVPIEESVLSFPLSGGYLLSYSKDGTLFYQPGSSLGQGQLVSVDLEGQETPLLDSRRHYVYPRFSPSGERLAVTVFDVDGTDLWVADLRTGVETKLTKGGGVKNSLWSPDGERLIFARETREPPVSVSLFSQKTDGSAPQELLLAAAEPAEQLWPHAISPEERLLVYGKANTFRSAVEEELWILDLESGETRSLIAAEGVEYYAAALSPHGRWLAYDSDSSGRREVYVQRFPEGQERYQLSTNGGGMPIWSPSGDRIFYTHDRHLMVVPISTEGEFRAGSPELLLDKTSDLGFYSNHPLYDLSPDGESFVMVREVESAKPPNEIRIVQNWFAELERLAPTP